MIFSVNKNNDDNLNETEIKYVCFYFVSYFSYFILCFYIYFILKLCFYYTNGLTLITLNNIPKNLKSNMTVKR